MHRYSSPVKSCRIAIDGTRYSAGGFWLWSQHRATTLVGSVMLPPRALVAGSCGESAGRTLRLGTRSGQPAVQRREDAVPSGTPSPFCGSGLSFGYLQ